MTVEAARARSSQIVSRGRSFKPRVEAIVKLISDELTMASDPMMQHDPHAGRADAADHTYMIGISPDGRSCGRSRSSFALARPERAASGMRGRLWVGSGKDGQQIERTCVYA